MPDSLKVGSTVEVCVPLAPLRVAASDRAEMSTQALAGERCIVQQIGTGDWIEVELVTDGYKGWTDAKQWALTGFPFREALPPASSCEQLVA